MSLSQYRPDPYKRINRFIRPVGPLLNPAATVYATAMSVCPSVRSSVRLSSETRAAAVAHDRPHRSQPAQRGLSVVYN